MRIKQVTTEMVLRLPAWAQEHINNINRLRFRAEQHLKKYLDDQTPSKVFISEDLSEHKSYIQNDQVTFELSTGNQIQVRHEGNSIRIMGIGFGELEIKPHVSNVVSITHK